MPHFYRYREEDNFELSRGRTPAALSPAPVRREVAEGAVAHVKLLGCEADLAIPEAGAETNQRNLTLLFAQLESTIKELKEENKQLRQDVEKLQERQHPQLLQVTGGKSDNSQLEKTINIRIDDVEKRMEEKWNEDQQSMILVSGEIKTLSASHQTLTTNQDLLSTSTKTELAELANKLSNLKLPAETVPILESPPVEGQEDLGEQVEQLKLKVESSISSMKSLVFAPLSVIFDAVRSEDWVGDDKYLTFTKLNINLGDGMDIDTGSFTVPVSGVYLFILNVYGAPRDAVVLSIRVNQLQEVASCSGVGKASQSVVVDMEKGDTVGVFVNEKSKLVDTEKNKFTHFLGILLRPDTVRF